MTESRIGRFVVTGTDAQITSVREALAQCRWPVADRLPRDITVTFKDLSAQGALGLFWTNGRIEIEQSLPAAKASAVFLAEAWHAIDQYVLTSGDRVTLLAAAHPEGADEHTWFDNQSYYADLGETMMDVFLATFTSYPPTGLAWSHPASSQLVETLRNVLDAPATTYTADDAALALQANRWLARPWWCKKNRALADALRAWKAAKGL